jgi:myosin heavy subunit
MATGYVDMRDPEVMESLKYLEVTKEERIKLTAMPFDAKKACWVHHPKEGFIAGEITATKGEEVTVKMADGETKNFKKDDALQMNPPKYTKCEDMADMTFLNDASVLNNLRTRYKDWLIYVSFFLSISLFSTKKLNVGLLN